MKDKLQGGNADNKTIKDIADKFNVATEKISDELDIGKSVEMEHTDDISLAKEIAKDHLEEIPDYYTRLDKMEKGGKKEWDKEVNETEDIIKHLLRSHLKY